MLYFNTNVGATLGDLVEGDSGGKTGCDISEPFFIWSLVVAYRPEPFRTQKISHAVH